MAKKSSVYKIRNRENGLYSKGGTHSGTIWTREGKTWSSRGAVMKHIRQFLNSDGSPYGGHPYENSELIEIELVESNKEDLLKLMIDIDK